MTNFVATLLTAIKQKKDGRIYFMGDYGVVIVYVRGGGIFWVESTWDAGFGELKRVVEWGGGSSRTKPLEPGDTSKQNVDLSEKDVVSQLLAWETERLHLGTLEEQPDTHLDDRFLRYMHVLLYGQETESGERVASSEVLGRLKELEGGKFTGMLGVNGGDGNVGCFFVVKGDAVAGFQFAAGAAHCGARSLQAVEALGTVDYTLRKSDLFTVANLLVPLWGKDGGELPAPDVMEFLHNSQKDIGSLHLLRLSVQQSMALGMVYRGVYAGTLVKKNPAHPPEIMPQAVFIKLSMLPDISIRKYHLAVG